MKLKEIQQQPLTCQLGPSHCCSWSEDNSVAALTRSGILVADFHFHPLKIPPNKQQTNSIRVHQRIIQASSYLPTNQFHEQVEEMLVTLKKEELYQIVLDKNLFPRFSRTETFIPICKQFAWSPRGLHLQNRCVLAVLTDAGSCDLYLRDRFDFVRHMNITEEWVRKCAEQWSGCNVSNFPDLCSKVQKIKAEVITWSHSVGDGPKRSALLLCAHENQEISLWRIETLSVTKKAPDRAFLDLLKPEVSGEIKFMKWSQISVKRSFLFISCLNGTAYAFDLEHDELLLSVSIKSSFHLWDSADRILISQIISLPHQDGASEALSVVMTKDVHLVVCRFSLKKKVPEKPVIMHKFTSSITGIKSFSSKQFICVLRNGQIHLVSVEKNSLASDIIDKDISYANYSCFGLALSQNKAFGVLFNCVSRFHDAFILKQTTHYHVVGFPEELVNPISNVDSALKSGSVPVSSIADIMQAIRLNSLPKDQSFPARLLDNIDLNSLNECSLQIGLQLAQIGSEADPVSSDKWTKLQGVMKTFLYIKYFIRKKLSSSLVCLWLRNAVNQLGENGAKVKADCLNYLQSIDSQDNIACAICSSDVSNVTVDHYTCSSGHKVPVCSLSFRPCLTVPYCICDGCGALALEEAVSSTFERCILCDGTFQLDQLFPSSFATNEAEQGNLEAKGEEKEMTQQTKKKKSKTKKQDKDELMDA